MKTVMPPLTIGPISQSQIEAFARASGDNNPLHVSASIAQTIGLDAAPVHGMLLVAFLHEAVRRYRPDAAISSLSTRFMAPVPVGETIEISGRVVKQGAFNETSIIRLFVKTGVGALACMAEATLSAQAGRAP